MAIKDFLSDIRNAALANVVIVVFHIWIAIEIEGLDFLVIVLPVGALIAAAYFIKGKMGAALLAIPTLGYLLIAPELIEGIITGELGPDDEDLDIGWGLDRYLLAPFWLFTTLLNIMSIIAEVRGTSKYSQQSSANSSES